MSSPGEALAVDACSADGGQQANVDVVYGRCIDQVRSTSTVATDGIATGCLAHQRCVSSRIPANYESSPPVPSRRRPLAIARQPSPSDELDPSQDGPSSRTTTRGLPLVVHRSCCLSIINVAVRI